MEYSIDSLSDKNLYNYCDNNPISRYDSNGEFWHTAVGAVFGAVCSAVAQVVTNVATGEKPLDGVIRAAAVGAISGGLAATGIGTLGQAVGNAALSAADSIYSQAKENGIKKVNVWQVMSDTIIGGLSGAAGSKGFSKSVNLKTLNKRLTSKVLSGSKTVVKKAVKYYVSQTKTLYKKGLIASIKKATYVSVGLKTSRYWLKRSRIIG